MNVTLIEAVRPADASGDSENRAPDAWRVRLIRAGLSKNRNNYPLKVLHEAVHLYEGVRALARSDDEHSTGKGKSARNVAGWFTEAKAVPEGIDATLNISEAAPWLKTMLWDAWNRGKKDILGFSHVAEAKAVYSRTADGLVRDVQKIAKVDFVDVVVDPSAGGEIVGLAEATDERNTTMLMEQLLKLIEALSPERFKTIDTAAVTEAEVVKILEAIQQEKAADHKADEKKADDNGDAAEALTAVTEALKSVREEITKIGDAAKETIARDRAVSLTEAVFAESGLPSEALDRVLAMVNGTAKPATKDEIEKFIAAEAKYLGITRGWKGPGSTTGGARITRDSADKWKAALDGLVAGERVVKLSEAQGDTMPAFTSLREAFRVGTGLDPLDGGFTSSLAEAAIQTSTFGGALGDSIRRKMQTEYRLAPYTDWRKVFPVVSVPDFRTNYRPQLGGFPTLPTVSQNAAYVEATALPGEFTAQYAVTKYGALQAITMEAIVNDDIGFVQKVPVKLGRAAARTLDTKVYLPLTGNGNVGYTLNGPTGDGAAVALFVAGASRGAAGVGNLGSASLSPAAIMAGRLVIMKQLEPNSGGAPLNLQPRFLLIPPDLESLAFELCYSQGQPTLATGDNQLRPNFIQKFGLEYVVIPQATDTNDWYLATDSKDIPTLEVGFLGGREDPELFIQDIPTGDVSATTGGMFSADRIVYKVRHIYGVGVMDFRGLYKSVVA